METVLYEQNPHWAGKEYDGFIQRHVLSELLHLLKLEEILVLKGVRRSGKTTVFYQIINRLIDTVDPKSILYINLDDPFFVPLNEDAKNLYTIVETAEKITDTKIKYLFLDEIQNIERWEKFVKSIYDSKRFKKMFVTGSNSQLLEGKYATLLSGRYVDQAIFPLSFSECLVNEKITDKLNLISRKPKVLAIFDDLLNYGSFPKAYLESDLSLKRRILTGYYNTILLKDCIASNNIRDRRLITQLAHYMVTNVSARYSYTNIASALDSNEKTIQEYIHLLEMGFLLEEVRTFSYSLKKQAKSNKKAFCIDNGLVTAIGFQFDIVHGKLFENLVYNELRKCGAQEIFIFFDTKECDFIVKVGSRCVAIQVCHTVTPESRQREISGIELAIKASSADRGFIVTYNQEELIKDNIHIMPFWKLFGFIENIEALFSEGF